MKIHTCLLSVFVAGIVWGAPPQAELKITATPPSDATGTMWYQDRVVFELEGYQPLVITADMEKGVFPTGGREVHKLGPARFLVLGGYSAGGGSYTKVATIIAGQNGRLIVQDQLEFSRDRGLYKDKVFQTGNSFAMAFQPLPAEGLRDLYNWYFTHKDTIYSEDSIRAWPLRRWKDADGKDVGDMITFMIGDKGFLLPNSSEAAQSDPGHSPKTGP